MAGCSTILTADTKEELKELTRKWFQKAFDKDGMFPRLIMNHDDYLKYGYEAINLIGDIDDNAIIIIKPTDEFKDVFFYQWLKLDARAKKFGCIVSAHC